MSQIFILESLRENDPKVGFEIFEELEKIQPNISKYLNISNKEDFFDKLQTIIEDTVGYDLPCYLHIDAHGDEVGIQLTNDECIDWSEFRVKFRELYIATGRQLIVCMSACRGYNISKMIAYFEPCPYYAICGSFEDIGFEESKNGYLTFYKTLLKDKSITEAILEVNKVEPDLKFIGHQSDALFNIAINGYTKKLTPEYLRSEKQKKIALVRNVWGNDTKRIAYLDQVYTVQGQLMMLQKKYRSIFFS